MEAIRRPADGMTVSQPFPAGTAGSEQRRGTVGAEPFQALDVAGAIEVALRVEVGDRE